jgi:hypothetical protein
MITARSVARSVPPTHRRFDCAVVSGLPSGSSIKPQCQPNAVVLEECAAVAFLRPRRPSREAHNGPAGAPLLEPELFGAGILHLLLRRLRLELAERAISRIQSIYPGLPR